MSAFYCAIGMQVLLAIWLLLSLRICKEDYHFWEKDSIIALKGYFSIVIVLFHVTFPNIVSSLYFTYLAVIIVTLFSCFSTYGMTIKICDNEAYIDTIPCRFVRVAILYGATLLFKYAVTGDMMSGGILWMNSLLLSYAVFYVVHRIGLMCAWERGTRDCIIIVFWIAYSVVMQLFPNNNSAWAAQSLGFAYGIILARFGESLTKFLCDNIKKIIVVSTLLLLIFAGIYWKISTPEAESVARYFLKIAMSFLMILLLLTLSARMKLRLVSKTMMYIGRISLYIYLLHGMVIDILEEYLADEWLIPGCIILTVILALCFYLITKKVIDMLRGFKRRMRKGR